MEQQPKYSAEWNMPDTYRGDTLPPYRFIVDRDLTGYTVRMHLRGGYGQRKVREWTGDNGGIQWEDRAAGTFVLQGWKAELAPGFYRYDLEFTGPDGVVRTWVHGRINIINDKTK